MNTPSKEALDASEAVQDYLGFPRRATMDLASIIDRHFEPLRQRAEKAEARVKELQKEEAESRRLFYAEQDKRQSAEFRCEELAGALREAQHLVVAWESADGEPATELLRRIDAVLAHHAAGEPEAQK